MCVCVCVQRLLAPFIVKKRLSYYLFNPWLSKKKVFYTTHTRNAVSLKQKLHTHTHIYIYRHI